MIQFKISMSQNTVSQDGCKGVYVLQCDNVCATV